MALIKCPECEKEISDNAISCPNCGFPLKEKDANTQETTDIESIKSSVEVGNPQKKKGCLRSCLTTIIVAVIGFVIIVLLIYKNSDKIWDAAISSGVETTTQFDKSSAEELDKEIWEQLLNSIKTQNNLMAAMADYSDGRISEVDFYDYCKEISKFAASASMAYPDSDNEGAKAYINSCETYAYYLQITADSLIKYIDSKATKDLSKAKENIENMQKAVSITLQNRGAFLISAGYTQEEVEQIANEAASAIEAQE